MEFSHSNVILAFENTLFVAHKDVLSTKTWRAFSKNELGLNYWRILRWACQDTEKGNIKKKKKGDTEKGERVFIRLI